MIARFFKGDDEVESWTMDYPPGIDHTVRIAGSEWRVYDVEWTGPEEAHVGVAEIATFEVEDQTKKAG